MHATISASAVIVSPMYTGAGEFPVDQEHRARPGEVHRHQGVKQSGREPSLNDQLAELFPGRRTGDRVERM